MSRPCIYALAVCLLISVSATGASSGDAEYVALRRMIGQERYVDALARCIELIKENPESLPLYETLPEVAGYAGNIDRAIVFLEARVEDGTALPLVYYGLGTAYYDRHDYRAAVVYFNNATEAGNASPECYRGLEYAYEKLEGLEAATRYFNLLCHRDPQNANNWYGLALAYWTRQDYDRVKSCLLEALARRPGERRYLQVQAATNYLLGEADSVYEKINKLIMIANDEFDLGGKEFLKSFIALSHFNRTRYQSAVPAIQEIINDSKYYGCLRWLGWGYKRMSDAKFLMGEYLPAISFAKEAASVAERVGDQELLMASLSRQFEGFSEIGDYYNALETAYKEQVFPQGKEVSSERIRPLVDIAVTLHDMGSDDLALEFAIEALGKCETVKIDNRLLYQIHICLGLIYEGLQNLGESIRHFRQAASQIPNDGFWSLNMAVCHGHLGRALLEKRHFGEARHHLNQQLALAKIEGNDREISYAEAYLGMLSLEKHEDRVSETMFRRSYARSSRLGQLPSMVICFRGLSELAERDHRLKEAALWRKRALAATDSMGLWHERLMLLGCSDRELVRDFHEYVRVLCNLRQYDLAFEAAEKAKVLALIKFVNLPLLEKSFAATDPTVGRLISLQKEIFGLHAKLASKKPPLVPANSAESSLNLISDLNHLEMGFQKILDTLCEHNPQLYYVLRPHAHSLQDIQSSMTKSRGALIEYIVGEARTSVIVITKDTVGSFEVPLSLDELKKLLRRISAIFVEGQPKVPVMNAALADIRLDALHLAFELLIEPALGLCKKVDRITIVRDGVLSNLPFELLVSNHLQKNDSPPRSRAHYLIEDFDINYALSASTALSEAGGTLRAPNVILAVGDATSLMDPKKDPILKGAQGMELPPSCYGRTLPGVKRELASIKRIFGQRAEILSRRDATAKRFSEVASRYRIIHIASHVDFDESRPLYSMIILSPDYEKEGKMGIRSIDFLSLALNADLVVLSGCNTGRISSSLDLSNMTSAIMLSGVPSVISSLWNVDDEVTAQLMESFYSNLNGGMGKGEALRKAKLEMIRSGKSDPFYWGAFILYGDGGDINLRNENEADRNEKEVYLAAVALVGLGVSSSIVAWYYHRKPRRRSVF